MSRYKFQQKSSITKASDGGMFIRIQKKHAEILGDDVKDKKVKVNLTIDY